MRSGEVDSGTRASVEEHLAGCADCKARLAPATVAMPGSAAVNAVLFPEEIAGVPRGWVYTVAALGSATLALSLAVLYLLARPATASDEEPGEPRHVARREVPSAPEPPAAPEPVMAAEPASVAPQVVAAAPAVPAPGEAPRSEPAVAGASAAKARPKASGAGDSPAPAAAPAPAPEPAAPATVAAPQPAAEPEPSAKPKDEIDALLFEAAGAVTAPPPVKEEKSDEATGLTRSQVVDVMNSIQDKVHACAAQTGKSGTVQITATIVPSGRVKSVRIAGMFAGTPAGDCVATAVRGAVFPTFVGQPQPVNYPVPLR